MSTEYASADDLLSGDDVGPVDVTLPSGRTVQVRGLSRYEYFLAGKTTEGDGNAFEVQVIKMGMVAPAMTQAQVEKWRKRPGVIADVAAVSNRIRDLSGAGEGADKSSV